MADEDAVDQGSSEIPRSREGRCQAQIEIASVLLLALVVSLDDGAEDDRHPGRGIEGRRTGYNLMCFRRSRIKGG
jgi:hypothetical protein